MAVTFQPGDDITAPAFRANLNRIADAAFPTPLPAQPGSAGWRDRAVYRSQVVRYTTAPALGVGRYVGIAPSVGAVGVSTCADAAAYDPTQHGQEIGVLVEPVVEGGSATVVRAGVVAAVVDVVETWHRAAVPGPDARLVSDPNGWIPIRSAAPAAVGVQPLWVELPPAPPPGWTRCRATVAIPAGSVIPLGAVGTVPDTTTRYHHAALSLPAWDGTDAADCPYPATILRVSPGYAVAVDAYFYAAPIEGAWVRLAPEVDDPAELVPGACVGVRADTAGQARAWLPGLRVLEYRAGGTGPDLVRVVPDGGVVTAAVTDALDAVPGYVEVALVRVEAGVGHPMQYATAPVAVRVATFDSVEE